MTRRAVIGGLLVLTVLVTACSGVPTSSSPEVIRSGGAGATAAPAPTISPQPGAEPRSIVQGFLLANVSSTDDKHTAAKQFLTADARTKWSDRTVTVVDDNLQVGLFDSGSSQVTVTATLEGTIGDTGIYVPAVRGDGTAPEAQSLNFGMVQVDGQWRINQLQPGLVITRTQLEQSYQLHSLYYFDLAAQRLVADPRYSPLEDGQRLATWLLNQLLAGPRTELTSAVLKLPDQFTPKSSSVIVGDPDPMTVELPGSSQLDPEALRRVAAQLATTLAVTPTTPMRITDDRRPVAVSGLPDPFTSADFAQQTGTGVVPQAFYVGEDGTVRGQDGAPIAGPLGRKLYNLTSVALAQDANGADDYPAAGVSGPTGSARLLVGTRLSGLKDAGVPTGQMTRPAWAPGQPEVWVGRGRSMLRVVNGARPVAVPVSVPVGQGGGTIRAIKFSRDGVRIAVVIASSDATAETYVGTVERPGKNSVRVDNLVPVTPADVDINDVAWNDDTTLYVIGTGSGGYGVWSVKTDGSLWTPRSRSNLPQTPQQIAAARDQLPWVSAGGAIFVQRSSSWSSPYGPPDTTVRGTSPTYLE